MESDLFHFMLFYDMRNLIRQYLPVVDRFNCKRVCKLWYKEDAAFSSPFTIDEETHKGKREATRRILFEWFDAGGLKWKQVRYQNHWYWNSYIRLSWFSIVLCPSQRKQMHTLDVEGRIMIEKQNPLLTEWTYDGGTYSCLEGGSVSVRYGLGDIEWKYSTHCPVCHYESNRYTSLHELIKHVPYSL